MLSMFEAQFPTPGPSQTGKTRAWPPSAKGIESDSGQQKLVLPNAFCSTMCLSTCRDGFAEPGLRAGARGMVRPAVASADHATSRAGPAFGTFASAETPKWSSHLWGDPRFITRTAEWPTSQTVNSTSTSTTYVDVRYSNRRTRNLSSVAGCGPRRRPRSRCGVWPTAFGRA
jgi:hypothetical protein